MSEAMGTKRKIGVALSQQSFVFLILVAKTATGAQVRDMDCYLARIR